MALALYDRVKETTTTVGTGSVTLLGATTGFQSFAVVGNANTTYYCIADQGGANWEVGIGTYTASGTTLARTTVLSSSNAGSLVTFTAGIKDVFVTYPSSKGLWKDASGNAIGLGTPAAFVGTNITGTASGLTAGNVTTNANLTGAITSSGNATSLGSFTSLQLATALTNETGTGSAVFSDNASLLNPTYTGTLTGGTGVLAIGTNQIYKDASGNVGIGTSIPLAKLDVNGITGWNGGSGAVSSFSGANVNLLNGGLVRVNSTTSATTDAGGALTLGGYYNAAAQAVDFASIAGRKENITAGNTAGYFQVSTRPSGGNLAERLRIDSSGSVGIGTTIPSTYGKLAVVNASASNTTVLGAALLTNRSYSTSNNGIALIATASNGSLNSHDFGAITFNEAPNSNGSSAYVNMYIGGLSSSYGNGSRFLQAYSPNGTSSYVALWTNGSECMRLDASGNVGIGTSSPTFKLDVVAAASNATAARFKNGSSATNNVQIRFAGANAGTDLWAIGNAIATDDATRNFDIFDLVASANRVRIDSSGNVGIGTTSPNASAILDVQSTAKGVRMPNMTTTQKNAIATPAAGLIVFDTTLAKLCVYSGAAWQTITSI